MPARSASGLEGGLRGLAWRVVRDRRRRASIVNGFSRTSDGFGFSLTWPMLDTNQVPSLESSDSFQARSDLIEVVSPPDYAGSTSAVTQWSAA